MVVELTPEKKKLIEDMSKKVTEAVGEMEKIVDRLEELLGMKKKSSYFINKLNKIADYVEKNIDPRLAFEIDKVSDFIQCEDDEPYIFDGDFRDGYPFGTMTALEWDKDEDWMKEEYNVADKQDVVRMRREPPVKDLGADEFWENPARSIEPVDYHWANKIAKSLRKLARELEGSV